MKLPKGNNDPRPRFQYIRKCFGVRPVIGDKVQGYLDFGVKYQGTVIEVGEYFLKVSGSTTFYNALNEQVEDTGDFLVPIGMAKHK